MLRRIFSKKTLLWLGIILAILTVLGLIFIAEENWRGRRAWETYRAAAEKRGVKLFLKDFIPPDIPDEENYAAVPVIREMFVERQLGTSAKIFPLPREKRPKFGDFATGRRTDLGEWQQFFIKNKLLETKTDSAPRDVFHAMEKFEPHLQQLRDASARPHCKFPTKWEKGIETKLPHLTPLQNAGLIFAIRMEAHLAEGASSAALSEFHHAMKLREALGSEPSFIAGLLRLANLGALERVIWSGLADHIWTDGDLSTIQQHLASLRLLDELQFGLETERGAVPEAILGLTTKNAAEIARSLAGFSGSSISDWTLFLNFYPKGWLFQNVVAMNEGLDALIAPYKAASTSGQHMKMDDAISPQEWLWSRGTRTGTVRAAYYRFLNFFLPVFESTQRRYFAAYTEWQQTLLGCALERFYLKRQAFPKKLEELVPEFIAEVPLDVGDGQPLRYRRNADGGYDVWSTGPDRKDDGGKIDPKKTGDEQADWLWHMPGELKNP